MADNLRDRITKAIADAQYEFDCGEPYNGPEDAGVLADAVIAELNLKITVDYMSADQQRRNWMVAGHCTIEVGND